MRLLLNMQKIREFKFEGTFQLAQELMKLVTPSGFGLLDMVVIDSHDNIISRGVIIEKTLSDGSKMYNLKLTQ